MKNLECYYIETNDIDSLFASQPQAAFLSQELLDGFLQNTFSAVTMLATTSDQICFLQDWEDREEVVLKDRLGFVDVKTV